MISADVVTDNTNACNLCRTYPDAACEIAMVTMYICLVGCWARFDQTLHGASVGKTLWNGQQVYLMFLLTTGKPFCWLAKSSEISSFELWQLSTAETFWTVQMHSSSLIQLRHLTMCSLRNEAASLLNDIIVIPYCVRITKYLWYISGRWCHPSPSAH